MTAKSLDAMPLNSFTFHMRRDGRVVEGACLERMCARKGTRGSNPFLSATERYLMKKKILIVEDDRDILTTLQELLESEGYEADIAVNGREALEILRNSNPTPDLIVMDFAMPVMDAPEFTIEQKKDSRIAEIPILLVTANADPEGKRAKIGARAFLKIGRASCRERVCQYV